MPNLSIEGSDRLADLLQRLVRILREEGGYTWDLVVRVTSGRIAVIEFDGHRLQLEGIDGDSYELRTSAAAPGSPLNFRTDAETVRDILAGRITLDEALATGRVFVRGELDDLLGMYRIVMNVLADTPRVPRLRRLGEYFERTWPDGDAGGPPRPLETQAPRHGHFIAQIPEPVLRIEVDR